MEHDKGRTLRWRASMRAGRVWRVEEVVRLETEGPSVEAPRVKLLLRLEREGEERFAGRIE